LASAPKISATVSRMTDWVRSLKRISVSLAETVNEGASIAAMAKEAVDRRSPVRVAGIEFWEGVELQIAWDVTPANPGIAAALLRRPAQRRPEINGGFRAGERSL
jgi:hypothetical protein